jgi:hypothetical protein
LDEIFDPEQRERITHQIVGFCNDYPKTRVIVTSRVIGYRRKILTDAGFTHFTLQDLDEKQIETFVSHWYDLAMSDRPDEAKERRERILRSFKESASIRQLAGNPMLLTIMAIIGKHQELPRERWKLYDHAASVLIQHWDVNKHLKDARIDADFIGEDDKKELLRRLAFRMQGGEGGLAGNYIHREQLQAEFESYLRERYAQAPDRAVTIARAMIEQFRERNFILSLYGANLYGFVHRAFLEYFCASAFVHKFEKTKELTIEQLKTDVYGKHWEDQSWHEVLRLICGMVDEKWTGEIIERLANDVYRPWPKEFGQRLPWNIGLAVQCLGEVRNLGAIASTGLCVLEVICALFEKDMKGALELQEFGSEQILPAVRKVGQDWPSRSRLASWLTNLVMHEITWEYAELLGEFIALIGSGLQEIYQVILDYSVRTLEDARVVALLALKDGWRNDPRAKSLMLEKAKDPSRWVRSAAIFGLSEDFREDAQTLPLLRERVVNDTAEQVRSSAVGALVQYFRDDTQTLLLLRERAVNDGSPTADDPNDKYYPREAAIEAIANNWPTHPDTLPLLRERAQNDPTPWLRERARKLADALEQGKPIEEIEEEE